MILELYYYIHEIDILHMDSEIYLHEVLIKEKYL